MPPSQGNSFSSFVTSILNDFLKIRLHCLDIDEFVHLKYILKKKDIIFYLD
jgi:hypothetical protein